MRVSIHVRGASEGGGENGAGAEGERENGGLKEALNAEGRNERRR